LQTKLTKDVSFTFLLAFALLSFSGFSYAQSDADAPTSISNPQVKAEISPERDEYPDLSDIPRAPDAIDAPVQQEGLEEIDAADVAYQDEGRDGSEVPPEDTVTPLSEEVEDLKKAALELNRDLLILEEELLFPANSQVVIFLSLDVGKYFSIDSVKVLIDDKMVASHLYTKRQNTALSLGGIQRLYLGNLRSGDHEVTAFFVGMGPDNREYKRGATIIINKDDDPKLLELKVWDSDANMQPQFKFEEWQL
jgi:hypothetical protein